MRILWPVPAEQNARLRVAATDDTAV